MSERLSIEEFDRIANAGEAIHVDTEYVDNYIFKIWEIDGKTYTEQYHRTTVYEDEHDTELESEKR